jgi:3-hydroxyisobutyrate dehydrogenase-like beta-hydroxyacid dehydrogenase
MGSRIVRRLIEAGHELVVWNRSAEKAEPLTALGAESVETPAAAAEQAEAVIIMVADPAALADVVEGPSGVAAGASGATVIQMSTVDPAAGERLAATLGDGADLLDAPVLGSLSEVEAGTLRVFASGPADVVERWTPLLSDLGEVMHVGPLGAGTAAKLVANSTLLAVLGALGEALALADGLGLERNVAFDVLATTALGPQAERRREPFETGEFPLRFELSLARKDGDLIRAAADEAGVDVRLAEAARSWFADAEAAGWGERDYSAVLAYISSGSHESSTT